MASPVKDAKLKAQTIWAGATVANRGKGSITHQHPTNLGRKMLDTQVGGRGWHFGDGPFTDAHEIDTAWVDAHPIDDAPWQKKMVLADYNAYAFREPTLRFDQGQLIEYRDPVSGEAVAFQPQELEWTNDLDQISPVEDPQAVSATINDDELKWADAYGSGIDFRWHTHTTSMAKYVDIDSLANLGSPPQFIIDGGNPVLRIGLIFQKSSGINIWVDGVEWDENPNNPQITLNNVEFRLASTGETLWVFRAPLGWDSGRYPLEPEAGTVYPSMRLRKSGPNLLVEILTPWSWLETANYPITLDATIDDDVDTGTDDGSITNTSDFNATGSTLYVGRGPGITNSRSWFLFGTISGLSGSTIDVSYITPRVNSSGTATKTNIFAEDAVSPNAPTSGADYDGITTTSASVPWDDLTNSDTPVNSPSINSIIQELADSYDPTTILILWKDDSSANNNYHTVRAYESSLDPCSIHIEYTEAGGSVDITIPVAALTLTGYVPTVATPVNITIPVASLALTGYAPTVETPVNVEVPVAALALTGYPPTVEVTANIDIEIPAASLALTGYAPDVEAIAGTNVTVPTGALTLTGYAPTVEATAHVDIEIPTASLALIGYAPTVQTPVDVEIPTAALALTGYAPDVEAIAGLNITVPAATLNLTGYAPTVEVTENVNVEVPAAALAITGFAPIVTVTAHIDIEVPAAALTLTGYPPDVEALEGLNITVPAGTLVITGYAPVVTVTENVNITVPAGALTLTGYAPTVDAQANVDIEIPVAALVLTGYAPTISVATPFFRTLTVQGEHIPETAYNLQGEHIVTGTLEGEHIPETEVDIEGEV